MIEGRLSIYQDVIFLEFDGVAEWYRSVCLKETNLGLSQQMLVDYGNVVNVLTQDIRQMRPEHLAIPALGLPAIIIGEFLLALQSTEKLSFWC